MNPMQDLMRAVSDLADSTQFSIRPKAWEAHARAAFLMRAVESNRPPLSTSGRLDEPLDATLGHAWDVHGTPAPRLLVGARIRSAEELGDCTGSWIHVGIEIISPFESPPVSFHISHSEMRDICRAVGIHLLEDFSQICGKPFVGYISSAGDFCHYFFPDEGNVPDVPLPGLTTAA